MMQNIMKIILVAIIITCLQKQLFSWSDVKTHPSLTRMSIAEAKIDDYLKSQLDIQGGLNTKIGIEAYSGNVDYDDTIYYAAWDLFWRANAAIGGTLRGYSQGAADLVLYQRSLLDWLTEGSSLEDGAVIRKRSRHHFYDPTCNFQDFNEPGRNAGLDNLTDHPYWWVYPPTWVNFDLTGQSALAWAKRGTYEKEPKINQFDWTDCRTYFYRSLTKGKAIHRFEYLALTACSLGHVLHLLEDMSVPAHTRNDFLFGHYRPPVSGGNPLETWVEEQIAANKDELPTNWFSGGWQCQPKCLDKFERYWDTNNYTGSYQASGIPSDWGLAECSNYQFLSYSTVFTENDTTRIKYSFPNPAFDHAQTVHIDTEKYWWGLRSVNYAYRGGYGVTHLVRDKYIEAYINGDDDPEVGYTTKDNTIFEDYAAITIPRTIDYTTGLANYFFRGRLEAEATGTDGNKTVLTITNTSYHTDTSHPYALKGGEFELYWDNQDNERTKIDDFTVFYPANSDNPWGSSSVLSYNGQTTAEFTPPTLGTGEQNLGYTLVYKGNINPNSTPNENDPDDPYAIAVTTFEFFFGQLGIQSSFMHSGCSGCYFEFSIKNISCPYTLKGGEFKLYWDNPDSGLREQVQEFTVLQPGSWGDPWNTQSSTLACNATTSARIPESFIVSLPEDPTDITYTLVYEGHINPTNNLTPNDPADVDAIATTTTELHLSSYPCQNCCGDDCDDCNDGPEFIELTFSGITPCYDCGMTERSYVCNINGSWILEKQGECSYQVITGILDDCEYPYLISCGFCSCTAAVIVTRYDWDTDHYCFYNYYSGVPNCDPDGCGWRDAVPFTLSDNMYTYCRSYWGPEPHNYGYGGQVTIDIP